MSKLTPEQLEEIRNRAGRPHSICFQELAVRDRVKLLAHIDALTAERDALLEIKGRYSVAERTIHQHLIMAGEDMGDEPDLIGAAFEDIPAALANARDRKRAQLEQRVIAEIHDSPIHPRIVKTQLLTAVCAVFAAEGAQDFGDMWGNVRLFRHLKAQAEPEIDWDARAAEWMADAMQDRDSQITKVFIYTEMKEVITGISLLDTANIHGKVGLRPDSPAALAAVAEWLKRQSEESKCT